MTFIRRNKNRIIPTVLLLVGIVFAFGHFIGENSSRIRQQNEEYLNELTTQRAASIDRLLKENLSFIRSTAYLYGESLTSPWADVAVIRNYEENSAFDMLRFVDASGDNYTSRGVVSNLSDRDYFQAGMRGESGVTYVLESRVTGEKQIGFYAPVSYEGQIIGVMVGFFGEEYIKQLLEYELFGYTGEGWLCDTDGTILGTTANADENNYLSYMKGRGKTDDAVQQALENAFASGTSLSFQYTSEDGKDATGYAASLQQTGWMLVRNFPPSASLQILNNANREGVVLIGTLVLLFLLYVFVIGAGIVMEHRREREANRNANDISTGVSRLFEHFVAVDLRDGAYRFIGGTPPAPSLAASGAYSDYIGTVLAGAQMEEKKELEAYFALEHLKTLLLSADRASVRVHAPMGKAECFTYNFIALERSAGQLTRLLIVCQDVTELFHKEAEEQKRLQEALDAAESASRAKTEFLFNMSHDLRTPMNAIIGYTELAQYEGVTQEQMLDYIRKIDSSSGHLLALINDILEMSRIESGKMTLEPEATDLVKTVEEARQLFETQMRTKQIAFTADTSGIRHRWVLCDGNRLNRILLNLLSNAWKFTGEGGSILLSLAEEDASGQEGRYTLRVRDSGIGMSPEFVEKLFTPFERERTSTVSKTQGTGLGLSITKKIVDMMGGAIRVSTEQGKGTEFMVSLPFTPAEPPQTDPAGPAQEEALPDFSSMRLLLVEDNMVNREIASLVLTESGFMLETAENGQIAVDMVAASKPGYYQAVLMDIQMPVMDGYTATRQIRALADERLAAIPIVAMTANAFQEDRQAAKEAGMNGHIAKPLDITKMMETLTEVLRGQGTL